MIGLILWILFIILICISVCGGWFYTLCWIIGGALGLYFGIKYEFNK